MLTKSGIMVGLGEEFDEVVELMKDLRSVSCDIMTIGQYLQPHARRLPVERYVTPEEFAKWRDIGMSLGFHHVESSPLTRSSYHAREQAQDKPDPWTAGISPASSQKGLLAENAGETPAVPGC